MTLLRVGTRTSDLALTQAKAAAQAIVDNSPELDGYDIVGITTRGDVDRASLAKIGGTGLFTSAVRQALLDGECDVVIHSAKDLPAANHPELSLFYPPRVSPADVLCAKAPFSDLPEGAKVGTGSPRRAAQLQAIRPDVTIVDIRGNVPTRLARIDDDLDAVILARAGLSRLSMDVGDDLPFEVMIPAAAQGALAIETRRDSQWEAVLARIDDPSTRAAVSAERAFMSALGAGCTTPVGVIGEFAGAELRLRARYIGNGLSVEREVSGSDPQALAMELADQFREDGVGTT